MGFKNSDTLREPDRQRPFSPPPANSGTWGTVLIVVAILFAVYKMVEWNFDQRQAEPAGTPAASDAPKMIQPAPEPQRQAATPAPPKLNVPGTHVVNKCVVNGKTSYGNGACAPGATASLLTTRDSHNLMAAVRPEAITLSEATVSQPDAVVKSGRAISIDSAKKSQCQALDATVKNLDAQSRQPQGPQMMDWIKAERKKARDQQFRLSC
jgi:hypothetical protein